MKMACATGFFRKPKTENRFRAALKAAGWRKAQAA